MASPETLAPTSRPVALAPASPSGPSLPGRVRSDLEETAHAEAHAREQTLALDITRTNVTTDLNLEPVPAPRSLAPPPKVKPPAWQRPPSAPEPKADFDDESALSEPLEDVVEGEETVVYKSKLEEFLIVERGMIMSCRKLPVTLVLWVSFVVLVFQHGQARTSFEAARYIENAVEALRTPRSLHPYQRELHLGNLLNPWEILNWTEYGLIAMLAEDQVDHGRMQNGAQVVVGFVRMTQTRGRETARCESLSPSLQRAYGQRSCHPPGLAARTYGFNVSELDDAFRETTPESSQFVAWVELGRPASTVAKRFYDLRTKGWIDMNTQAITIDALMFAPKVNVYSRFEISFELHREGLVERQFKVQPLRGDVYGHWTHIFFDIIWLAALARLLMMATIEAVSASAGGSKIMLHHFTDVCVWLDWGCIVGGFVLGLFFWVITKYLHGIANGVFDVGTTMPPYSVVDAPQSLEITMVIENKAYQDRMALLLDDFGWLCTQTTRHRLCVFWYSMVLAYSLLRGLAGQPRVAVLVQVILSAWDYFMHYVVVGSLVLFSFVLMGHVLFGEQLQNWSTFGRSLDSMFAVLFGRISYEELHAVAPIHAASWFWFCYVFVRLLLLSIITSAVLHRYSDVKRRLGEQGNGIFAQIKDMVNVLRFRLSYEGARKTIPYDILLQVLSEEKTNPAALRRKGRLLVDRRIRTKQDLYKEENDKQVDVDYLVDRGCDRATAEHLLDRCTRWCNSVAMTASPEHRLVVKVSRHVNNIIADTSKVRECMQSRIKCADGILERTDLKHAKTWAMARRVKKAQELPEGWEEHKLEDGRSCLRHKESGLTSWTLPRNMIQ